MSALLSITVSPLDLRFHLSCDRLVCRFRLMEIATAASRRTQFGFAPSGEIRRRDTSASTARSLLEYRSRQPSLSLPLSMYGISDLDL